MVSVREAARLQSFPDGFKFVGPMNTAFQQIGNSVPPMMAFAVAEKMCAQLQEAISHLSLEHLARMGIIDKDQKIIVKIPVDNG